MTDIDSLVAVIRQAKRLREHAKEALVALKAGNDRDRDIALARARKCVIAINKVANGKEA